MPGKMGYFVYTSDDGHRYIVKLFEHNANLPGAGFEPYDRSHGQLAGLPIGLEMRHVHFQQVGRRRRRKIYCGRTDAPLWRVGGEIDLMDYDTFQMVKWVATGRTAESRRMVEWRGRR
ncbi:MAG: hypothetical protein HY329_20865 [Chloroflexi bacterium]|nr:hypothetical protein [Chloroflexota bacterium]